MQRVALQGVSKRYGRRFAVDRVTLDIERGAPCVLMGENGAGKTTLLQIVSTVLAPDEGQVTYATAAGALTGRELRRRLGLITHQPMVYPELTGLENVVHFAKIAGISDPRGAARDLLSDLGLDPDSNQPAAQFSRGMQARLGAARALITRPELLLLDEAASGLDRRGRQALLDRILELGRQAVVLMATHHVDVAARMAHHLVVLERGRVAAKLTLADDDEPTRRHRIEQALDDPSGPRKKEP